MAFVKLALKIGVTVGLVWFLVSNIDLAQTASYMARADLVLFAAACVLILLQLGTIAIRWSQILPLTGPPSSLPLLMRLTLEGMFFNQALPSSVGGDAIRIYRLVKTGVRTSRAISSVILDRALGLLGLVLISATFAPNFISLIDDPAMRNGGLLIIAAALGVFAVFLALDLFPDSLRRWKAVSEFLNISRLARRVLTTPSVLLRIGPITLLGQMMALSSFYVLALALQIDISYAVCMAVIPVVILITTIPVTIAGWGLREGAMVLALGQVGVNEAQALALSILFGLTQIVAGLPGGVFWLITRQSRPESNESNEPSK